MNIQLNKNILSIFLFAAVLALLSACGSSSSGGTAATPPACNPDTHFCDSNSDSTGALKSACVMATHNCATGNLLPACNPVTHFCETTGIAKAGCAALGTHDCETGALLTVCDPLTTDCDANPVASYTPPDPIPNDPDTSMPYASWDLAIADYKGTQYNLGGGGADRIGAAYAYARGYTGEGVVVSTMGGTVSIFNRDITVNVLASADGTTFQGYTADTMTSGSDAGICRAIDGNDCTDVQSTHFASVIAGVRTVNDDFGGQGIAYDAQIKPVDIFTNDIFENDFVKVNDVAENRVAKRKAAIEAASGMTNDGAGMSPITVMNNGWDDSVAATITTSLGSRSFKRAGSFLAINDMEKTAWQAAVADADTGRTIVVFAAGDSGQNSINGVQQSYTNITLTTEAELFNWSDVPSGGGNFSSTHARLPNEVDGLEGKWLSVIALDENNLILPVSNGCGDTKGWCLGAPGKDINAATPTGFEELSGTGPAAAHVSGAIAVLKQAFPTMTSTELVSLILTTADYIPEDNTDTETDGTNAVYGHGALNLARASEPVTIMDEASITSFGNQRLEGARIDNSGITLPTSFGSSLNGFKVGFIDDYRRAFIGYPERITRENAAFTLGDTFATWESPELQSIALDSNSKMQFTNYDENADAKDTLIFTHTLPNHTIAFSYNEESKTPDLMLAGDKDELHFQKIRPIASDLMQVNSTHKLGKAWNVKNAITSGEFDTGNRFNEAMANLNYTGENRNLTIGAGTLKEYGQFLGASGTGAYQLSDATQSQVTHLAITQNLPLNSTIKAKYTNFKTETDMRYNNFANINDLTADEYQLSLTKKQILGKNDSLNLELIQPFAVTDGTLQQSTVLGYNDAGEYNNVTQNYSLAPTNRRQQLRMTWQNQMNHKNKTKLFISMQYENHVNNLRDNNDSQILGGISTKF